MGEPPMAVNTRPISAGQTCDVLLQGFGTQAAGDMTASWMLHGRPGIGRTEIVQAVADATGATLFDLRLTMIEPQDLRGLPTYDHATRRTVWYRPEDLPDDPATMHGLTALVYGLVTAADATTLPAAIGIMAEIRHLSRLRDDPVFARLPLAELCTHGFEMLIRRALDRGWQAAFLTSPTYATYAAERRAAGLE